MSYNQRRPKNVIIFGETGVGKSSVVNMLLGRNAALVTDSAVGCTFDYQAYPYGDYVFYDTAGLNEGSRGTIDITKSITQLAKLIESLCKDGVHLLLFVIKKDKIKESMENNFELFVNTICDKQVPVILAITHCEQEKEMGDWWEENSEYFDEDSQMEVKDCVSVCASKGDGLVEVFAELMKDRFEKSKTTLWECVERNALEDGWKMANWYDWFMMVMNKFWIKFCNLTPFALWTLVKQVVDQIGQQ